MEEQTMFSQMWKAYRGIILRSIVTSFGLDFIVQDQHGGDVDTIHGVRESGIYKNPLNETAYQNRGKYNGTDYHHNDAYDSTIRLAKESHAFFEDAYVPGNRIYYGKASGLGTEHRANLDHVISAHEIHDDRGRVLAGLDGVELALVRRHVVDYLALHGHGSFVRFAETGDQAQRRGLAAARRTEESHKLAALDIEGYVVKHFLVAERLGNVVQTDDDILFFCHVGCGKLEEIEFEEIGGAGRQIQVGVGAQEGLGHGRGDHEMDAEILAVAKRIPVAEYAAEETARKCIFVPVAAERVVAQLSNQTEFVRYLCHQGQGSGLEEIGDIEVRAERQHVGEADLGAECADPAPGAGMGHGAHHGDRFAFIEGVEGICVMSQVGGFEETIHSRIGGHLQRNRQGLVGILPAEAPAPLVDLEVVPEERIHLPVRVVVIFLDFEIGDAHLVLAGGNEEIAQFQRQVGPVHPVAFGSLSGHAIKRSRVFDV